MCCDNNVNTLCVSAWDNRQQRGDVERVREATLPTTLDTAGQAHIFRPHRTTLVTLLTYKDLKVCQVCELEASSSQLLNFKEPPLSYITSLDSADKLKPLCRPHAAIQCVGKQSYIEGLDLCSIEWAYIMRRPADGA